MAEHNDRIPNVAGGSRASEQRGRSVGTHQQDYIIRRLLNREIVVQGNPRVYKQLRDQLAAVLDELKRINTGSEVHDELLKP